MSIVRAESSALIRASARAVYQLIADYRDGHPRMLPKKYFPRMEVERGGVGAGQACRVAIRTECDAKGFRGWVERITAPRLLQRLYAEELANLAALAERSR